ncbi:DUF5004 domain-containing protein [Maribacter dokdonensis]|uniref:DUF5004 domain-containing protein n=1 Tax=Maribacter dokdonensis TaxID=320912 RepID=UPI002AB212DE|nr:DUF5004 domain-containing protein [Maribacter dokdonensis]
MNFKLLIPLLFLASITTQCSFIEIEHEEDLIIQIEGKWKLISVTFDGKQNITNCDKTTLSEFTLNPYDDKDFSFDYSGDYVGTVYFYTEALESCNPETFVGTWNWYDDEVHLTLNITGTSSGNTYTNDFNMSYSYINGTEEIDQIILSFENEDEDFERVYIYERAL